MPAAVILVGALVMLSPWVVRNYLRFGRFLVGTSHGGYTLMLGNNPEFYTFLRTAEWGDVWDSQSLDAEYNAAKTRLDGDELKADRWAYQQAFRCMREDPQMLCYSTLVRITRLWGCIPHQVRSSESTVTQLARWAVGAWYVMVYALALVGVFSLGRRLFRLPWAWGLTLCLAFTAVHALYWSNLRMRAPLIPVVCLVAAVGAARLSGGKHCLYR